MKDKKDIGMDVDAPKQSCNDKDCPFHGNLRCRGRVFTGVVLSTKMHKTAIVEWNRIQYVQKFERYEKKRTRVKAHVPPCINIKDGEVVKISQCRPLSKTKNFVVVKSIGKEKGFQERIEALEEGKFKEKETKEEEDESAKSESQ